MASKLYDWHIRNGQNQPKNDQKTAIFGLFSSFSKTVHTIRTKFSTVILRHIRVLFVQWHLNRLTGIRASQKEKRNPHMRLWFEVPFGAGTKISRTFHQSFDASDLQRLYFPPRVVMIMTQFFQSFHLRNDSEYSLVE